MYLWTRPLQLSQTWGMLQPSRHASSRSSRTRGVRPPADALRRWWHRWAPRRDVPTSGGWWGSCWLGNRSGSWGVQLSLPSQPSTCLQAKSWWVLPYPPLFPSLPRICPHLPSCPHSWISCPSCRISSLQDSFSCLFLVRLQRTQLPGWWPSTDRQHRTSSMRCRPQYSWPCSQAAMASSSPCWSCHRRWGKPLRWTSALPLGSWCRGWACARPTTPRPSLYAPQYAGQSTSCPATSYPHSHCHKTSHDAHWGNDRWVPSLGHTASGLSPSL